LIPIGLWTRGQKNYKFERVDQGSVKENSSQIFRRLEISKNSGSFVFGKKIVNKNENIFYSINKSYVCVWHMSQIV
jgi:hypothetical protein